KPLRHYAVAAPGLHGDLIQYARLAVLGSQFEDPVDEDRVAIDGEAFDLAHRHGAEPAGDIDLMSNQRVAAMAGVAEIFLNRDVLMIEIDQCAHIVPRLDAGDEFTDAIQSGHCQ